ncbi:MAG: BREX-1 system phosphatase PglZ type A [Anaerolineales bacterium]|nr:BREX-1 system phosphatase PglZ type A [Anaerolineales bacterium]
MNQITTALARLFERHRIIFWYDSKEELLPEFEAVSLPNVEKAVLDNNQFGLKYRLLRQQPKQKFLLYYAGNPPADLDNWLLDVQLAHGEFRADQTSLWLNELGLGLEFTDVIAPHADFFKAASRRHALKALLTPTDTARQIQLKMTAVCAAAEPRLETILENLLAELAEAKDDKIRLLQRCNLDTFLWSRTEQAYGYRSDSPGIHDFAITLFQSAYLYGIGETGALNNDAFVFLKRWKDSIRYQSAFATLSADISNILNIGDDLAQRTISQLGDLDTFELIEQKIVHDLVRDVARRTISSEDCEHIVRQRSQSHWYQHYASIYEAVRLAAQFLQQIDTLDLTMSSFAHGLQLYGRRWFQLDQLYRQFVYHVRQSDQITLLQSLLEEVDNRYSNQYLLPLNDRWQVMVDATTNWSDVAQPRQANFFADSVEPFLRRDKKVVVIISDALRYEIGDELLDRIRQEDRYEATLSPLITLLPSFTQLGMAALLPHETLSIAADGKTVLVDGQSSAGTGNRQKILQKRLGERGTAVRANELLNMSREESRTLFREHDVVYVYHNQIDATGDKRESEERVFDAVAATLDELIVLVKKLANANATNMFITADHGFIYQHTALDESDFASKKEMGDQIITRNRRFVLGHGLTANNSFKWFDSAAIGLEGQIEMLLPKSINRLRVQGAGSRYVHGGATLQEIVVPLLQINKKRQSDVRQVEVDILRGASVLITTNQFSARFYQQEPVTAKVQSRILRAGLYSQAGGLISDQHELHFDLTATNERERELSVQFILTRQASAADGQEAILRLEEKVAGTSHYREYKTLRYTLRRSFTSDFDF